jgi:hypothetical protein
MQNYGPLNPTLGETLQTQKQDGTKLFCEQISHHPPVTYVLMTGPKNSYILTGDGELDAKLSGLNHIVGSNKGQNTITFYDGGKITFTNPDMKIDSLILGDRRINYIKSVLFFDKKNHLSAELTFNYDESGSFAKFAGKIKGLFKSKLKATADMMQINFYTYQTDNQGNLAKTLLGTGSGSWLSYLEIDGNIYWKVNDPIKIFWESDPRKLPSDSRFRLDSYYIQLKDFDRAQMEKDRIENLQRSDKKLRDNYDKNHKKKIIK